MQSMQRRFGRTTTKRADDSQVAVLLKDFDDADTLLSRIVDSTKAWRDAWVSIATFQSRMIDEFDGMYAPLVGSSETPAVHKPEETDPILLARTNRLRREYDELRDDMIQELGAVETRMTQPAASAKSYLDPMKKVIKKRNEKKVDFEKYQGKVDSLISKPKRSDRENANLDKANADCATAKDVYNAADHDLLQRLPTLISLLFSLAPIILRAQVEIQNRMLAHYYTVLHTYCEDEGFPSPPPPMDQVVNEWELAIQPAQSRIEGLGCLAQGKAIRRENEAQARNKRPPLGDRTASNITTRSVSSIRSTRTAPPPVLATKPCGLEARSPSPASSLMTARGSFSVGSIASSASTPPLASGGDHYMPPPVESPAPTPAVAPVVSPFPQPVAAPTGVRMSPAGPNIDYFQHSQQTKPSPLGATDLASAIKKKRPPPPPSKPKPVFVTAVYDFDGQGSGDLSFREGDRIRVVHKTDSVDDWWEGELHGQLGPFPANYVE
ncbi:hypothetical protein N7512_003500 [Penicillium capsulatum]|nr:hypothetical protein N7512_003500 [Penicillium capsulatum]